MSKLNNLCEASTGAPHPQLNILLVLESVESIRIFNTFLFVSQTVIRLLRHKWTQVDSYLGS